MVTKESIEEQLKKVGFNYHGWGRTEINELPNIILPDEQIFECANGIYEGGFALLVATNIRVLLVDKKPMKFLTVEDLRFDMINEIDYSHRLFGAQIKIATGSKTLRFTSYNQPKLRKLIGHVQHCMAENKKQQSKHEEDQKLHLEQINQQLQAYLLAQHQQQQKIQEHLEKSAGQPVDIKPVRPAPELSDYLYAQSLLAEYQNQRVSDDRKDNKGTEQTVAQPPEQALPRAVAATSQPAAARYSDDLYAEGVQEIFGKRTGAPEQPQPAQAVGAAAVADSTASASSSLPQSPLQLTSQVVQHALEVNPLRVAYSKLPLAMRNRRFGRPSFHAHSQSEEPMPAAPAHS